MSFIVLSETVAPLAQISAAGCVSGCNPRCVFSMRIVITAQRSKAEKHTRNGSRTWRNAPTMRIRCSPPWTRRNAPHICDKSSLKVNFPNLSTKCCEPLKKSSQRCNLLNQLCCQIFRELRGASACCYVVQSCA